MVSPLEEYFCLSSLEIYFFNFFNFYFFVTENQPNNEPTRVEYCWYLDFGEILYCYKEKMVSG